MQIARLRHIAWETASWHLDWLTYQTLCWSSYDHGCLDNVECVQDPLLDEHIRAVAAAMPQTLQPSTAASPASDDSSATILAAALNVASAASVAPLTVVAARDEAQVLAGSTN